MVIVEGPDGSGKSNLVKRIFEDWTGEFVLQARAVSADAKALIPIGQYISDELAKGFGMRLYDRFALISSPMYMTLPNRTFREELLDFDWLKHAYLRFQQIDPAIIYCLPPLEVVVKNCLADGTSEVAHKDIETIYWNYHAFAARVYSTSMMVWDYTKPDYLQLGSLLRWAEARAKERDGADEIARRSKWTTSS